MAAMGTAALENAKNAFEMAKFAAKVATRIGSQKKWTWFRWAKAAAVEVVRDPEYRAQVYPVAIASASVVVAYTAVVVAITQTVGQEPNRDTPGPEAKRPSTSCERDSVEAEERRGETEVAASRWRNRMEGRVWKGRSTPSKLPCFGTSRGRGGLVDMIAPVEPTWYDV